MLHEWTELDEAVVIGVPDSVYGERACAFVRARRDGLSMADMRAFLARTRLEKFKWPEYLVTVPDLPRTASGKVRKQVLREQWVHDRDAAEGR